jgi:pyrroloquinoline quinone (PQQ) biosynthesis protein C
MTSASAARVIAAMDQEVEAFIARTRWFHEPMNLGRARMFVLQHRQNSRYRNSVLKLRVATNIPDWDRRLQVIHAISQEIIADHEYGGGRPHFEILKDLGLAIGLKVEEIENAPLLPSTRIAWLAWEALMSNRHWLEGVVGNTCAERVNVPGYGRAVFGPDGYSGFERRRWSQALGLHEDQLEFFTIHKEADTEHSRLGWESVARFALELGMEDAVVEATRTNLQVWSMYWDGIAAAGDDELNATLTSSERS